ncbi:MAG: NAD-dependent malic enzyme [Chlamydiae bacterium]|nr:NAD-dependent malic enzyme [Chlamydiota bacterium]
MKKVFTPLRGMDLLRSPLLNKGTAFSLQERETFHLQGLLPHHISDIEEQVKRRYQNFSSKLRNIDKYQFLSSLQNRNEILFYRLVIEHIDEMLPFIYTPTVGEASVDYSLHYYQSRGLYISHDLRHSLDQLFSQVDGKNVDVIVITDGGRILGLGDMGVGGMAICVGKLALYTLFGGISPYRVLPILLDVGTNNDMLLKDPLYLGVRHQRISGEEYDQFVDQVVHSIKKHCPNALLQWEDFPREHAYKLYHRYQKTLCSFNDDIQGTATVSLAALLSGLRMAERDFYNEKICILGAGSAGLGIAELLVDYAVSKGLSREQMYENIFFVDTEGLVQNSYSRLTDELKPFVKEGKESFMSLEDVVREYPITTLIGVSTNKGSFTKSIVKRMLKYTKKPIIFPLSNPTEKAEADPKDLLKWTDNKAIIATGSPFENIAQCNNVLVFPAIGLAASAVRMKEIPKESFLIAAQVLSSQAKDELFPPFSQLRAVTRTMAYAIAKDAIERGIAQEHIENLESCIESAMWFPNYPDLFAAE